jgi:hypothetical protein
MITHCVILDTTNVLLYPVATCNVVSYDIVSFLIPNPQHTVSLYTFIYQESEWSGRSGFVPSEIPGDKYIYICNTEE